jgi:hypothetical protein
MAGFFICNQRLIDMPSMPDVNLPAAFLTTGLARLCRPLVSLMLAGLLSACAGWPDADAPPGARALTPWDAASVRVGAGTGAAGSAASQWQHHTFPGKSANQFAYLQLDGRLAMGVRSKGAASMLRKTVSIDPAQLASLRFSWKVPSLIEGADMAQPEKSDSPVRLVLAFEGDRSRLSPRDHMLSELARAITGEDMPYATLMYVWSSHHAPGTVLKSSRTDRIRKLVLESGPNRLNRWLDYERDIRADFVQAYGEEPGRLIAVGIMTDTDNTRASTQAWYGPVVFGPAAPGAAR